MIIVDTGFWLALFNSRDHWHPRAKAFMSQLEEPLITTLPVITETAYLLSQRSGLDNAIEFIEDAHRGQFDVFDIGQGNFGRMAILMRQYADLPMDLADASLVVLAEQLGHGRILSTDQRDFQAYRWKRHHPFVNLLSDTNP